MIYSMSSLTFETHILRMCVCVWFSTHIKKVSCDPTMLMAKHKNTVISVPELILPSFALSSPGGPRGMENSFGQHLMQKKLLQATFLDSIFQAFHNVRRDGSHQRRHCIRFSFPDLVGTGNASGLGPLLKHGQGRATVEIIRAIYYIFRNYPL